MFGLGFGAPTINGTGNVGDAKTGDIVYDTSSNKFAGRTNTAWLSFAFESDSVPVGSILPFAGSTAPDGYLLCDGASKDKTTYAALYAVIGNTYGGDATTFKLPDLRGIFLKGAGTTDREEGKDAAGNYYNGTLGTYGQDQMQGHRHNAQYLPMETNNYFSAGINSTVLQGAGSGTTFAHTITGDGTNGTPRSGALTEPAHVGVNFIIKCQ